MISKDIATLKEEELYKLLDVASETITLIKKELARRKRVERIKVLKIVCNPIRDWAKKELGIKLKYTTRCLYCSKGDLDSETFNKLEEFVKESPFVIFSFAAWPDKVKIMPRYQLKTMNGLKREISNLDPVILLRLREKGMFRELNAESEIEIQK